MTTNRTPLALALVVVPLAFALGYFVVGPRLSAQADSSRSAVASALPAAPPSAISQPASRAKPRVTVTACPTEQHSEVNAPSAPAVSARPAEPHAAKSDPAQDAPDAVVVDSDAAASPGQLFRVQAGSFSTRQAADSLSARLRASGYGSTVRTTTRDGKCLYSVQVGAFRTAENAESTAGQLRASGFDAYISAPEQASSSVQQP